MSLQSRRDDINVTLSGLNSNLFAIYINSIRQRRIITAKTSPDAFYYAPFYPEKPLPPLR